MARHTGKDAEFEHDGNSVDGIRSMEFEETIPVVDLSAAGDSWKTYGTGISDWTGSLSCVRDHVTSSNQTLRVGDAITGSWYTEGSASGKVYFEGAAIVTSVKFSSPHEGEVTVEYGLQGNGVLTRETVA